MWFKNISNQHCYPSSSVLAHAHKSAIFETVTFFLKKMTSLNSTQHSRATNQKKSNELILTKSW